jgi:hypothetical protein
MNNVLVADSAALSAPVVLILLIGVIILLGIRAGYSALGIGFTRFVSRMLDASIAVTFIAFVVFVFVRFKIIG